MYHVHFFWLLSALEAAKLNCYSLRLGNGRAGADDCYVHWTKSAFIENVISVVVGLVPLGAAPGGRKAIELVALAPLACGMCSLAGRAGADDDCYVHWTKSTFIENVISVVIGLVPLGAAPGGRKAIELVALAPLQLWGLWGSSSGSWPWLAFHSTRSLDLKKSSLMQWRRTRAKTWRTHDARMIHEPHTTTRRVPTWKC